MGIKVKVLTPKLLSTRNLDQTAIIVTGTRIDKPQEAPKARIIVGEWYSRDAAYYFCRDNKIKRCVRGGTETGSVYQVEVPYHPLNLIWNIG